MDRLTELNAIIASCHRAGDYDSWFEELCSERNTLQDANDFALWEAEEEAFRAEQAKFNADEQTINFEVSI